MDNKGNTSNNLEEQFKKIVGEYSKLKTKNNVLKKAYLEQNVEIQKLNETIKSKEQTAREATIEIDKLQFNNERLTKRCTLLVEQIEEMKTKGGGGWFGGKAEAQKLKNSINVLQGELEIKIKENESLHIKIFEMNSQFNSQIENLNKQLNMQIESSKKLQEELELKSKNLGSQIETLQNQKHKVETENSINLNKFLNISEQFTNLKNESSLNISNLNSRLENFQILFSKKVPFNDTSLPLFHSYNLQPIASFVNLPFFFFTIKWQISRKSFKFSCYFYTLYFVKFIKRKNSSF